MAEFVSVGEILRESLSEIVPGMGATPAPKAKLYHRAKLISPGGKVSPLCAPMPRAIDLKRASWTIRDEAVTCPKCKKIIAEKSAAE